MDPTIAEAHYNRGALLWAFGRREQAEADLAEAVRLMPALAARVEAIRLKTE
jgi:hypothetical protein